MRADHLAIARRHARLLPSGFPMKCRAALIENRPNSKPKIIYDNKEAAEAARIEFENLPNATYLRAYPCQRSLHGHYHLTSDGHAAKVYARRNNAPAKENQP